VTNKPAPSGNAGFFHPLPEERVRAGIKRQQFRRRRSRRSGRTVVGGDACTPLLVFLWGPCAARADTALEVVALRQVAILNRETAQGADRRIAEEIRVLIRATGARETRRSMMTQQGRAALARFSSEGYIFGYMVQSSPARSSLYSDKRFRIFGADERT